MRFQVWRPYVLLAALAGLLMLATPAFAGAKPIDAHASRWAETDHGAVRLIAAVEGVGSSGRVTLGLQFRMRDGWKIYWRSPGDAGYPPSVDWSGSRNFADATLLWPAPERFTVLGLETIGYKDAVVLPIELTLEEAGTPLYVQAQVDYLTCDDICVPYTADLALMVPAGPATPTSFAETIGRYLGAIPTLGDSGTFKVERIEAIDGTDESQLRIVVHSAQDDEVVDVFVEGPPEWAFDAPKRSEDTDPGRSTFLLTAYSLDEQAGPLSGTELTVTAIGGGRAVEQRLTVGDAAQSVNPPDRRVSGSFLAILGIALLGGLILNLMPCVLPVLSIKLLSVVSHGGASPRTVRFGFASTAAGIIVSFLILALIMSILTAAGAAVGWGLQFQSPWFLITMTLVVALFASNLWGAFDVPLPEGIADAGARISHTGGMGSQFLTGVLATILATPCSAPFVGTALGYALSRGALEIFAVFTAMGTGLALPYLLVASFPMLATRMPRPGPWMIWVKRLLGLALAGTAVWLLFVLSALIGKQAAALTAAAIMLTVALLFFRSRLAGSGRIAASLAIVLLGFSAFVPLSGARDMERVTAAEHGADHWMPLAAERISELVAEGQVVYVNVTADWCVTCKVNENLVLKSASVRDRLASSEIVAMRGDWTRADDDITRYLASFGRYGIPFDAVYGPGQTNGEALPELLSIDVVLDALDRAQAPRHASDNAARPSTEQ